MDHPDHKGQWGSKFGFLMAAVGSAVGLGNLWGFPYKMGMNGGFAFFLIYIIMVAVVGVIIMLAELSLGRKTGKGVISAFRDAGRKYAFIGWLEWLSPMLILGFYSMLGGYCIKYAVANFGDIFHASWGVGDQASGDFFTAFFTNQFETSIYTLIFVFIGTFVVLRGVANGVERFATIAMPALFVMLVIIIVRSCTLPGAMEGLEFVFKPNFEVFSGAGWIKVLASAGGQMFFSLSLGMAIMVVYGSYMRKEDDLEQSAIIVPVADTVVAVMAGMAIMPAVFASGLDPAGGPGLLFVTLQTVFSAMSGAGPVFGFIFYVLVFIAAVTSSISLTEAVSASIMDKSIAKGKGANRKKAVTGIGIFVACEGVLVSLDGLGANGFPTFFGQSCLLDAFDLISEGLFMPIGALLTAILFGWIKKGWLDDEIRDLGENGQSAFRMRPYFYFCLRFIVPPVLALVLAGQIDTFFGLGIFK